MARPAGRVLVLTQGFPRHPEDHHAPFVLDHARALVAAGAKVTVLCPSGPGLATRDGFGDIDVVRFRYAPRRFETLAYTGAMHRRARGARLLLVPLFLAGFLAAALRHARDHEVLHGHWWIPSGFVAVAAGRLTGTASVVHLHGTDAAITRGLLRPLARWTLRHAGAVIASSEDLAAWAKAIAGVDAETAPMPLAGDRVPAPTPPPGAGRVLAVGRLVPEKGFDVLVRAAAKARVAVTIVGDGDQRAELERLAAETGAAVDFVGAVPPPALAAHYAAARLVAVPSRREGFGLVAAEALAAGRAVVASNVGGLPDLVADGVNGALVAAGDVDALAAALAGTDPGLGAHGPDSVEWMQPPLIGARNREIHAVAVARARPAVAPLLFRITAAVVAVVAVALAGRALAAQWDDARRLRVEWAAVPVATAVAATVAANLVLAGSWAWLVRRLGGAIVWPTALRIWWTGQLGTYLPTGLGSVPARLALGVREGVARRPLVVATGAEPVALVVAAAVLAAVLLPAPLAVAVAGALFAFAAAAVTLAARRAERSFAVAAGAGFVAAQVAQVSIRAAGFAALLTMFDPVTRPGPLHTAGAVGFGYLVGLLAVFAPGGVAVREAGIAGVLAATTGPVAATAAVVAWRLVEVAVVLPSAALAQLLGRRD